MPDSQDTVGIVATAAIPELYRDRETMSMPQAANRGRYSQARGALCETAFVLGV